MTFEQAFYTFMGVSICALSILALIFERAERKHRKEMRDLVKKTDEWDDLK